MQTLLMKCRVLVLALVVAALFVALSAGTAGAQTGNQTQVTPSVSYNDLWKSVGLNSVGESDAGKAKNALEAMDGGAASTGAPTPATAPAPKATPAPAPKAEAKLPASGGNSNALLFAAIAGALLLVGAITTIGRKIVRKPRS